MPEFDWDDSNRQHVREHDVEPEEAEAAMVDPNQVPLGERVVNGELRGTIIGMTASSRVIVVAYTIRDERYRVVTAYPARPRYRRSYWEARGQ